MARETRSSDLPSDLVRDDVRRMRGYTPGEQVNDAVKLNTNESAFPPSPAVLARLARFAEAELRLYPDPQATALREAAAGVYGVSPEEVVAGNGSDDCLTVLYRSHCRPGDRVACPWPTYGLYDTLATLQGTELVRVPYRDTGPAGSWSLPDELSEVDARLVLVANPNNPSGTLAPTDTLRRLADAIDGILVVDEAYHDFASGDGLLPHLQDHPNLVVLRTCSKSYGLAGARLGLLFAHPTLCAEYRKVKDSYNVNAVTQALGIVALEDQAHLRTLVGDTLAGRERLASAFAELGWTWAPSQANFLLCDVGPEAGTLYRTLKDRGILVRWWDNDQMRDRLRISVGTPEQNERLVAALRELVTR